MSTTALSAFVPEIQHSARQCPSFVMEDALLTAARQFCDQTWSWTHDWTLYLIEDIQEYDFSNICSIPEYSEVIGVYSCLDENDNAYDGYTLDLDADSFELDSEPSDDFELEIKVVLRPTLGASTVPDFLYNRHRKTIGHLALYYLLTQPGADWSNAELGLHHEQLYRRFMAAEKRKRTKGFQRNSINVKMRTFI